MKHPFFGYAIVALAIAGCAKQSAPLKTWQRAKAESVFNELGMMKNDAERSFARCYIKALVELEKGGSPDKVFSHGTLLFMAVMRQDIDIVEKLLSLDVYADVDCVDGHGNTPLLVACEQGSSDIAVKLIEAGARVNRQNKDGKTALMVCAQKGNRDVAKALVNAGANLELRDVNGKLFGDYAIYGNNTDMIQFISGLRNP